VVDNKSFYFSVKDFYKLKIKEYINKYNIAKKMYLNKTSMVEIKRILGIDIQTFRNNLKSENLFVDKNIDVGLKYDIFNKIDTYEKAYWLGFLYADGYVDEKKNGIELCIKDYEHMEKFKEFLNTRCSICNKIAMGNTYYRLSIRNKNIVKDLVKSGCFQAKSCKIKFPDESILPKDLINDFVRGYFDGNGCIFFCKKIIGISLDSSKEFLDTLKQIYSLKENKYARDGKAYAYHLCASKEVKSFLDSIYKDSKIYLDRKYKKYFEYYAVLDSNI
jgi:predicted nucleic-acid-binding protein